MGSSVMALERELETYARELPNLTASEGKFVLIHADEVEVFESYEDALRIGYERYGLDPFLVKRIESVETIHFLTRDVLPCR